MSQSKDINHPFNHKSTSTSFTTEIPTVISSVSFESLQIGIQENLTGLPNESKKVFHAMMQSSNQNSKESGHKTSSLCLVEKEQFQKPF